MIKLDIVIVTFNRLEKLQKTLICYHNQTASFRSIIVVNNNSTDGTDIFLEEWKKDKAVYDKYVITLNENIGGAGGFYTGQRFAMSLNPDWVYVADDDAYPDMHMVGCFYEYLKKTSDEDLAAVCATVFNNDGSISCEHRSKYELINGFRFIRTSSRLSDYYDTFEIDLLSYVGSFINAHALKKVGCCIPDLFIYSDDTEHSIRLRKYGKIVCLPQLKIVHDCGEVADSESNKKMTWRNYYHIRNNLYMLRKHFKKSYIYYFARTLLDVLYKWITHEYHQDDCKLVIKAVFDSMKNNLKKYK